jgi:hypothetical protein
VRKTIAAVVLVLIFVSAAYAQQEYVGRFDVFGGFSYFTSAKLNLVERGFNGQAGVNVFRWLAVGFDFSVFNGHTSLLATELNPSVQAQLAPLLATLPPGTVIAVPFDATTYTYSAGPQINIRHFKPVTLFVRPALGAINERVTTKPNSPLTVALVNSLVGPSGKVSDTVVFYGFGGGIDWNVTKHFAIRTAADFVHLNLFEGLLNGGRNSVRVSVGPAFHFGGNVEK